MSKHSAPTRRLAAALDRWWRRPAPAERLARFRLLVGTFALIDLLARFVHLLSYASFPPEQFSPVGIVVLVSRPLPLNVALAVQCAAVFAGAAFVLGWHFRFSGPLFALLLAWVLSYRNSFGQIFHTENLALLHVWIAGLSSAADAESLDVKLKRTQRREETNYGWPLQLASTVTALTYVIAGLAKLRNAGPIWISGDVLRNYVAYDNLRKLKLGSIHSPVGGWLVRVAWLWPPIAALTLVVELAAPLALISRKIALLWVGSAFAFHLGVVALMAIVFPYHLSLIAYASFFRLERMSLLTRVLRRAL